MFSRLNWNLPSLPAHRSIQIQKYPKVQINNWIGIAKSIGEQKTVNRSKASFIST